MSNPSPIQPSLDLLSPALGILDLFAHRNKNQHRLSKWWAQFDMLRRGARKLLADMQASLDSQAKLSSSKKKPSRQKDRDNALRRKMETRAAYLEEHVLPRAFLAFTQLAADNQYAHLGLALVGVLAQVHAAVEPLVPPLGTGEDDGGGLSFVTKVVTTDSGGDVRQSADLGVAVSRSEIERSMPDPPRKAKAEQAGTAEEIVEAVAEERQTSRVTGAVEDVLDEELVKAEQKPKKLKKSRDEFDNLFDSLETKRPPKKKKRKKADEFDSLFSSLM